MNKLKVNIKDDHEDDGEIYSGVELEIDGTTLKELVRQVESIYAVQEKHPKLAGNYALVPVSVYIKSDLMLGGPEGEKVILMQCSCGESGCWPLLAKVLVNEETVVWCDFEQPHRGPDSATLHWKYGEFGPFIFDRREYENEIEKIA